MTGIHDVFLADEDKSNDPISYKKIDREGQFSTWKCILGFNFDGVEKTLWLENEKWDLF